MISAIVIIGKVVLTSELPKFRRIGHAGSLAAAHLDEAANRFAAGHLEQVNRCLRMPRTTENAAVFSEQWIDVSWTNEVLGRRVIIRQSSNCGRSGFCTHTGSTVAMVDGHEERRLMRRGVRLLIDDGAQPQAFRNVGG